ncbi:hypothetical protein ACJX0J_009137, partial [Zea mays]
LATIPQVLMPIAIQIYLSTMSQERLNGLSTYSTEKDMLKNILDLYPGKGVRQIVREQLDTEPHYGPDMQDNLMAAGWWLQHRNRLLYGLYGTYDGYELNL